MTAALDLLRETVQGWDHEGAVLDLPLDIVHPDPSQPRQDAQEDREALEQLAESIKTTRGAIQPISVEPHPDIEGHWQIVAGERRYHATALAGLSTIRALRVPPLSEETRVTLQLIENDQRKDLDLLSRAAAYDRLQRLSKKKPADIARSLGISRSEFSNTCRVLHASAFTKAAVLDRLISDPEAVRYAEKLSEERRQRIYEAARRSGNPVSRTTLARALQEEEAAASPPVEPAPPSPEPPSLTSVSSSAAAATEAEPPIAMPALAPRYMRLLFRLLDLEFPSEAQQAPNALVEFLLTVDR